MYFPFVWMLQPLNYIRNELNIQLGKVSKLNRHTHASIKNIKEYAPKDIFAVNFIFCFDS